MHRFPSFSLRIAGWALLMLMAGATVPAAGQSAQDIVARMKAHYEQQLAAVDSYIIETDQYTSYHRKVTTDGAVHYQSTTKWKNESGLMAPVTPSTQPGLGQLDSLARNVEYKGTETIDGRTAHVLLVDDPSILNDPDAAAEDEDVEQGPMTMYVDAERYVPLRFEGTIKVDQDGETKTLHPHIVFQDYRTTDGLMLPWTVSMKMEDLNASMSPEEREEARQSLAKMEEQMAQMPDEQRKMMEGMMKKQLGRLRQVLEEGTIEYTIQVQDVKVNVPIPDGVFDDAQ